MLLSSTIQHRDAAGERRNLAVLTVDSLTGKVYLDLASPGNRLFLSQDEWSTCRSALREVLHEVELIAGSATSVMSKLKNRSSSTEGPLVFAHPVYGTEPDITVWRDQLRITTLGRRRMVVFLDIDGVLATDKSYGPWTAAGRPKDKHPLDRTLVRELDVILIEAGADVVLSSSWRYPRNFGYEGTVKHLRDARFTSPVIGHTPMPGECRYDRQKLSFRLPRGYEIFQVVEDLMLCPDEFIILDDDEATGYVPPGKPQFRDRWIKTPEPTGLTEKYQKRLRKMLQLRQPR